MRILGWFAIAGALSLSVAAVAQIPSWSKNALLEPRRRPPPPEPPIAHERASFEGAGITLEGWRFPAQSPRKGLIVYLHGFNDDRREAVGIARNGPPRPPIGRNVRNGPPIVLPRPVAIADEGCSSA